MAIAFGTRRNHVKIDAFGEEMLLPKESKFEDLSEHTAPAGLQTMDAAATDTYVSPMIPKGACYRVGWNGPDRFAKKPAKPVVELDPATEHLNISKRFYEPRTFAKIEGQRTDRDWVNFGVEHMGITDQQFDSKIVSELVVAAMAESYKIAGQDGNSQQETQEQIVDEEPILKNTADALSNAVLFSSEVVAGNNENEESPPRSVSPSAGYGHGSRSGSVSTDTTVKAVSIAGHSATDDSSAGKLTSVLLRLYAEHEDRDTEAYLKLLESYSNTLAVTRRFKMDVLAAIQQAES